MTSKTKIKPIAITLIVVGFLFLIKYLFPLYRVNSFAIEGFSKGDIVLVSRFASTTYKDIVVYQINDDLHLSRIMGIYHDTLFYSNGILYRNNEVIEDEYVRYDYYIFCTPNIDKKLIAKYEMIYPKREYRALLKENEAKALKIEKEILKVQRIIVPTDVGLILKKDSLLNVIKDNFNQQIIAPENYWVMNDNRVNCDDSRAFGSIAKRKIVGKVLFKLNF